ncbi:MAG TPA: O-antigen polymerase [Candidatus Sulfotelmatobacter sp.]|nr:O-antigen polymerase [Candidatus Sulfotelmatobacter sp.]
MHLLISPWLPWSVLFALSLIARIYQGSWLAPSAFVGLMWSAYSGLPLIVTRDHISPQSMWMLLVLIACLQVGAFLFVDPAGWKNTEVRLNQSALDSVGDRCLRLSLYFAAAAMLGAAIYAAIWLRNLHLSFSLDGFFSLGGIMYDIVVGGEPDPWWYRLLRMWVFPSVLLGGFASPLVRSRTKKLLALSGFFPSLFMGTAIASRFATLVAIACWMAGYLSMKCFVSRGRFRITTKFVATLLIIVVAAVAMFAGLYAVRGRPFNDASEATVKIAADILSYLAVFDSYAKNHESQPLGFGAYTIGGVFEFLGLKDRIRNVNWELVDLESGITSNIYTAFRGLIDDFSFVGSMFLCLIAGAFVGRAYSQLCSGRISLLWVLTAYYAWVLFSPIVSAFYYNSVPLALFVGALVLRDSKFNLLSRYRVPASAAQLA